MKVGLVVPVVLVGKGAGLGLECVACGGCDSGCNGGGGGGEGVGGGD